jgi:hypothetical protein
MDSIATVLLTHIDDVLLKLILIGICIWVWRANATLIKLEICMETLQKSFKEHDIWERELRNRWENDVREMLHKIER